MEPAVRNRVPETEVPGAGAWVEGRLLVHLQDSGIDDAQGQPTQGAEGWRLIWYLWRRWTRSERFIEPAGGVRFSR
jgi:hypothetical protein